ncbi:elongation of very long chain fatty acids protein 4-like [Bombyx mandarina]|uniref:Elongation of very long chain fatty acids protein n=1 Tax=Bombyx mandarina TaxID=7092 RepID=A0A6J2JE63_BOMMA|nr:elongation of very long chain fatty acids protein 4-like [Bombyx mandarina]
MEWLRKYYHTVFYDRADQRVKDWLFMTSPWPIVAILTTYLLLIKFILPIYMRNKRPYNLKGVIKSYNVTMIVFNLVVAWGIATSGWTTTYHFGCVLPDYTTKPEPMRMLTFMWWTLTIKMTELLETAIFLLRKKNQQASFLHVYHHVISLVMIWCGVKYIGGGMASFPVMINSGVHVVMYCYYLLSADGSPRVKAYLHRYKKWLTIIQMVQFTILLAHALQAFLPSCPAPLTIAYMYLPNVLIVYYMFYEFFKKNYSENHKISK